MMLDWILVLIFHFVQIKVDHVTDLQVTVLILTNFC